MDDPKGFLGFVTVRIPHRIAASLGRMAKWLRGEPIANYNHAFMNYAMVRILPGSMCSERQIVCIPHGSRKRQLSVTSM